ncbi:hypothetical protein [Burkholderia multivorans]|uniref:hypothetical protein n=1 Tax=Burkholderia multivorans TaxID=87883 RepID=UPI0021C08085|nr:hypothetical protein [Burkholderia multivorans]MDR9177946.1 hypothetical protein [Burkholderia multivorans]MDR9183968.1 hypothetical protein [Burkholderia multivorans]MDR9187440.1 hypothetical protein [Burkholderia multivorans]MDR9195176.1 hypothetical protein [Burkholderia multivorans]MDR9200872.1 hypothetical protein [Burkholderia multivorans]
MNDEQQSRADALTQDERDAFGRLVARAATFPDHNGRSGPVTRVGYTDLQTVVALVKRAILSPVEQPAAAPSDNVHLLAALDMHRAENKVQISDVSPTSLDEFYSKAEPDSEILKLVEHYGCALLKQRTDEATAILEQIQTLATSGNETGAEGLLRRARDELSLVEWEDDPPTRVIELFDDIEAYVSRSPAVASAAPADELTDADIWRMWNSIDQNVSATRPILFARALLSRRAAAPASAHERGAEGSNDLNERAHLAAGQWANANTPISEALAYRDGYIAGAHCGAMAATAPAADKRDAVPKWIFDQMVDTLTPAWDYVQAHQEQFNARAGDDKTKIVVEEFLKHARAAASPAAVIPAGWNCVPNIPPAEVIEFYGAQYSAPVLLHDGKTIMPVVARWDFTSDGWVDAQFRDGPSPADYEWLNERTKCWLLLSAAPQPAQADAPAELRYATELAVSLWRQHFDVSAPNWKPLPDLMGVLTQISNMTCGLVKAEAGEARLTDEQREAIEYAITWMAQNVSNRYAYTAAKELRALLNGADR